MNFVNLNLYRIVYFNVLTSIFNRQRWAWRIKNMVEDKVYECMGELFLDKIQT